LLHHAEPKLFFDLMHMFESFEFGFVFEFELSSLEKIILSSGAGVSAPVALARAPLSVSASRALTVSAMSHFPHTTPPSLCTVGLPCQLCLPRELSWTSAHAYREPRPCRLPTHPSSLLSTAHTRTLSPASLRTSSPTLALCFRLSRSPEFRAHCASYLAR
jgi:hypothetical protein